MNWLTIVLAVVIGFLTYRAYRSGFIRELVSLCAIILAVPFAGIFYDNMYPKVQPLVENRELASLISFLSIMAGVIIGGQVVAHLMKNVVAALNLGLIDHVAGALFGFVKGVVLCQVLLIAFVTFPRPDITETIDESPLATQLLDAAPGLLTVLPSHFDESVDFFLKNARTLDERIAPSPTPAVKP